MKQIKNENAVDSIAGVIIMVAITVILAAVIAAFIFGMSGNITKTQSEYVSCSDYYQVVDMYCTPSGNYVVYSGVYRGIPTTDTRVVTLDRYKLTTVGSYAQITGWDYLPVNLTYINESVSGLTDSCKVVNLN